MNIGGVIIELFSNNAKQGENIEKVYQNLNIPLIARLAPPKYSIPTLLPTLHKLSQNYAGLAIGYDDSEFYVMDENKKLLESFQTYNPDIAYGDGYPEGMTFLLLRPEILPIMENIRQTQKIPLDRTVFHKIIETDVNTFDIDNIYPPLSLRTLRLSFFSNNPQNHYTLSQLKKLPALNALLATRNGCYNFTELATLVRQNKIKLKTLPKYYQFTLSSYTQTTNTLFPHSTLTPPPPPPPHLLNLAHYKIMLKKAIAFSQNPVIALNGLGEVSHHPQWLDFVAYTLKHNLTCLVEMYGTAFTKTTSTALLKLANGNPKLKIIFKIHSTSAATHAQVCGTAPYTTLAEFIPHFNHRLENIEHYLLRNPNHSYVEITKVRENINHLSQTYHHFKRYTPNVLIAKYNSYRHHLPERRDNPMQPFQPIDCWHLKRDMYIDEYGDVWVCQQDFKKEHTLGNLITDPLPTIFENGLPYYKKHLNNWEFCKNCDENYTYNF